MTREQLKAAWLKYDQGDKLTNHELESLLRNIEEGITFLVSRGETGGVLFKARMDRESLTGFFHARNLSKPEGPFKLLHYRHKDMVCKACGDLIPKNTSCARSLNGSVHLGCLE